MARHGSAIAEHPSPAAPSEAARRGLGDRGAAGWPIRRKLAALVALPTGPDDRSGRLPGFTVLRKLAAGRRRAQIDADIVISANALTTAADSELQQTLAARLKSAAAIRTCRPTPQGHGRGPAWRLIRKDKATTSISPGRRLVENVARRTRGEVRAVQQNMADLRKIADNNKLQLATVAQGYDVAVQPGADLTTAVSAELRTHTPNPRAVDGASVLARSARPRSRASQELVLLTNALHENRANAAKVNEIAEAAVSQKALLDLSPGPGGRRPAGPGFTAVLVQDAEMVRAHHRDRPGRRQRHRPARSRTRTRWTVAVVAGKRLDMLNNLVSSGATDLQKQTTDDRRAALWRLVFLGGLALASMVLISLLVRAGPNDHRADAPAAQRRRRGGHGAAAGRRPPDRARGGAPTSRAAGAAGRGQRRPETREVAQALDGLTGEAIRLATSQVRLRQALDEAFVSMSRRSQSMVEKQLAIIDELESTEEDPEQLRNLFRLDHLAARMRRYNDNLLVLAGSAVRTRSSAPVAIAERLPRGDQRDGAVRAGPAAAGQRRLGRRRGRRRADPPGGRAAGQRGDVLAADQPDRALRGLHPRRRPSARGPRRRRGHQPR